MGQLTLLAEEYARDLSLKLMSVFCPARKVDELENDGQHLLSDRRPAAVRLRARISENRAHPKWGTRAITRCYDRSFRNFDSVRKAKAPSSGEPSWRGAQFSLSFSAIQRHRTGYKPPRICASGETSGLSLQRLGGGCHRYNLKYKQLRITTGCSNSAEAGRAPWGLESRPEPVGPTDAWPCGCLKKGFPKEVLLPHILPPEGGEAPTSGAPVPQPAVSFSDCLFS